MFRTNKTSELLAGVLPHQRNAHIDTARKNACRIRMKKKKKKKKNQLRYGTNSTEVEKKVERKDDKVRDHYESWFQSWPSTEWWSVYRL